MIGFVFRRGRLQILVGLKDAAGAEQVQVLGKIAVKAAMEKGFITVELGFDLAFGGHGIDSRRAGSFHGMGSGAEAP